MSINKPLIRLLPRSYFRSLLKSKQLISFFSTSSYNSQSAQTFNEPPRINQVGIQYLSNDLHKKVFPQTSTSDYLNPSHPALVKASQQHLKHNNLLGKKTQLSEPINIKNFPDLVGANTLDEHFHKIGLQSSHPYLSMAELFLAENVQLPTKPDKWIFKPGWTRYEPGKKPQSVDFPQEDELVFDVETMYKQTQYSCLATAVSPKAWYGWVSPFLIQYSKDDLFNDHNFLIPLDCFNRPKLLVGFNVSYDRARILEEYNINQSKAFYLDAMALHISLSGICSQQRPTWLKHKKSKTKLENQSNEEDDENSSTNSSLSDHSDMLSAKDLANELLDDPWLDKGSPNSLANVADFHCGIKMNKSTRDVFATHDPMDIINDFNNLMNYCADDVQATHSVASKLFPEFRRRTPHPVSFAALRHLGTLMLPTTKKWDNYIETAENLYQKNRDEVTKILMGSANELIEWIEKQDDSKRPDIENDPWLSQLDWTIKEKRFKKNGEPVARQAFLTGYPNWYRDLFKSSTSSDKDNKSNEREMKISVRTRVTPILLKLKWEGYPLLWTDTCGWCFKIPHDDKLIQKMIEKNYEVAKLNEEEFENLLPILRDSGTFYELFRVPHPDGKGKRCTSIMSKSYLNYFEDGTLSSEFNYAKEILKLNSYASYWMGNRSRITEQFVVYNDANSNKNDFFSNDELNKSNNNMGIIIPKLCSMGTITRRATENTWLTASNSKKTRIGSELKAMVEAPKGYTFVGADVDSEELWIASLIGDSTFSLHGATALGWMTLEGDKNEGTDLHSKTAQILGILRGDAKVFNYGRIYGAGVKFATRLLKQCNNKLSDSEAEKIAKELYVNTKGEVSSSKFLKTRMYHGGTESVMFNILESIAYLENPKTPVLGASITDALTARNLNKNNYLTSRVNWTIQSSGVDYLHLLIVSMEYLTKKYKVDARLIITVHDELRFMTKEANKYKIALLLQISNLWTRAMFCEQLGLKELPQSCAFFSEVDIDKILRKEVTLDCVTPSHPNAIAPGESYDIIKLLEIGGDDILKNDDTMDNQANQFFSNIEYKSRKRVIDSLDTESSPLLKLTKANLQNATNKDIWRTYMNEYIKFKKLIEEDKDMKENNNKLRSDEASTSSIGKRVSRTRKNVPEFNLGVDGNELLQQEIQSIGKVSKSTSKVKPKVGSFTKSSELKANSLKVNDSKIGETNITKVKKKIESTAKIKTTKRSTNIESEPKTKSAAKIKSDSTIQPKAKIVKSTTKKSVTGKLGSGLKRPSTSTNSTNTLLDNNVKMSEKKILSSNPTNSKTSSSSGSKTGSTFNNPRIGSTMKSKSTVVRNVSTINYKGSSMNTKSNSNVNLNGTLFDYSGKVNPNKSRGFGKIPTLKDSFDRTIMTKSIKNENKTKLDSIDSSNGLILSRRPK